MVASMSLDMVTFRRVDEPLASAEAMSSLCVMLFDAGTWIVPSNVCGVILIIMMHLLFCDDVFIKLARLHFEKVSFSDLIQYDECDFSAAPLLVMHDLRDEFQSGNGD